VHPNGQHTLLSTALLQKLCCGSQFCWSSGRWYVLRASAAACSCLVHGGVAEGRAALSLLPCRNAAEAEPRTKCWLDGASIFRAGQEAVLVSEAACSSSSLQQHQQLRAYSAMCSCSSSCKQTRACTCVMNMYSLHTSHCI
jgi:hypothetical protein